MTQSSTPGISIWKNDFPELNKPYKKFSDYRKGALKRIADEAELFAADELIHYMAVRRTQGSQNKTTKRAEKKKLEKEARERLKGCRVDELKRQEVYCFIASCLTFGKHQKIEDLNIDLAERDPQLGLKLKLLNSDGRRELSEYFRIGFQIFFPEPLDSQAHKNRSRYATALAYAYLHNVPVVFLSGFLTSAGGYDVVHGKYLQNHREVRFYGALAE